MEAYNELEDIITTDEDTDVINWIENISHDNK
jgi:hypothetical protein